MVVAPEAALRNVPLMLRNAGPEPPSMVNVPALVIVPPLLTFTDTPSVVVDANDIAPLLVNVLGTFTLMLEPVDGCTSRLIPAGALPVTLALVPVKRKVPPPADAPMAS